MLERLGNSHFNEGKGAVAGVKKWQHSGRHGDSQRGMAQWKRLR